MVLVIHCLAIDRGAAMRNTHKSRQGPQRDSAVPNTVRRDKVWAFTVVELAVSMAVLAALAAMLLPAVQASREVARRTQCLSQQRQVLLAFQQHAEVHGVFPGTTYEKEHWQIRILPFIEVIKPEVSRRGVELTHTPPVRLLACPSDAYATGMVDLDSISYSPNDGTGPSLSDGLYARDGAAPVRPSDVTDGLSSTMCLSERLAFPGDAVAATLGFAHPVFKHRVVRETRTTKAALDDFALECEVRSDPPWLMRAILSSFNTIQTPNRHSCRNGENGELPGPAATASSAHAAGVNVGFGDGSVRFVADSIDRHVWRSLGSRSGNDIAALQD
jgi:prepilin-type processing-associated H-X9-DG protein